AFAFPRSPEETMPDFVYVFAAFAVIAIIALFVVLRRSSQVEDVPMYNPTVSASASSDFRLTVEDIFSIKGRGLVVTGKVESGTIMVGQRIQIASSDGSQQLQSQVRGLEMFHKQTQTAQAEDNVGILLSDLTKDQLKPGMIITLA